MGRNESSSTCSCLYIGFKFIISSSLKIWKTVGRTTPWSSWIHSKSARYNNPKDSIWRRTQINYLRTHNWIYVVPFNCLPFVMLCKNICLAFPALEFQVSKNRKISSIQKNFIHRSRFNTLLTPRDDKTLEKIILIAIFMLRKFNLLKG